MSVINIGLGRKTMSSPPHNGNGQPGGLTLISVQYLGVVSTGRSSLPDCPVNTEPRGCVGSASFNIYCPFSAYLRTCRCAEAQTETLILTHL